MASAQTIETVPPSSLLVCPTIVFRVSRRGESPDEPRVMAATNIQIFLIVHSPLLLALHG